ncbi:MAG: DUF192 domain-containing protein [Tateyamaria sp.]
MGCALRTLFVSLSVWLIAAGAHAACSVDTVWIRGDFGTARFSVEIADNDASRAQGLMHRTEMGASEGMLFVYDQPRSLSFWMRNTLIPLDMLFIDPTGTVAKVHHEAVPLDETPIFGGDGLTHVLEINGGLARDLGIMAGAQVRHPSLAAETAAWPC